MAFVIKRVYDEPDLSDGYRVLVDRLWPRGLRKESAAIDEWCKAVTPSSELRKAFHADTISWEDFAHAYAEELELVAEPVARLRDRAAHQTVTLLYASRNSDQNHAMVLQRFLSSPLG